MTTAKYVLIDGEAYSPGHKKALALQSASAPQPRVSGPDSASPLEEGTRSAKRLRQSSAPKMNKLEQEFYEALRNSEMLCVNVQSISFVLGNGVKYTPDFCAWNKDGTMRCFEVKGFMRDDAAVKLKVAATMFPMIKWNLVWKVGPNWREQGILP